MGGGRWGERGSSSSKTQPHHAVGGRKGGRRRRERKTINGENTWKRSKVSPS